MMTPLLRAIVQGESAAGKTSLLAGAANAGYRILLADFDHCPEPLAAYAQGKNWHVIPFYDEVSFADEDGITTKPKALIQFERFLYRGKTPDGRDFGKPSEWDAETILVLDTLTSLGDAAEVRALALNPSTREGKHLWQAAQEQEQVCQMMLRLSCHVVVLSHLRLISPKAESNYSDETTLQKQIKRERAALEETGYFPTAVAPSIARNFTRHFPFALLVEEDLAAKHPSKRVLRTKLVQGYRIKCPVEVEDKLPIETGLVTIIQALQH